MMSLAGNTILTAGALAGALTAIGMFLYGGWRVMLAAMRRAMGEFHEQIAESPLGTLVGEIGVTVSDILHELHPNGGDSMRDAVDRIEESQQTDHDQLIRLEERVTALEDHRVNAT